jgi:hypothetical protein
LLNTEANEENKKMGKKRELSEIERRAGRDPNYWQMSPERQWEDDDMGGILDWDGTEEWLTNRGK